MAWTTPTLVEICIGLEINAYLQAEFGFYIALGLPTRSPVQSRAFWSASRCDEPQ